MGFVGGVELGGTNIVCAYIEKQHVSSPFDNMFHRYEFQTSLKPNNDIAKIADFFDQVPAEIESVGIASFGPLNLKSGTITTTPKDGWQDYPLVSKLQSFFPNTQFIIDTDVNGAVIGEWKYGVGKGYSHLHYITVGTGIAVGSIIGGKVLHGFTHPEMGHIPVKLHPYDLEIDFKGVCSYHHDQRNICLEGVASGEAIKARWGWHQYNITNNNWKLAWEIEAYYLAQLITTLIYSFSPEIIIMGGGVMLGQPHLIETIRQNTISVASNYLNNPKIDDEIDDFIVLPGLGDNSGIVGALELAAQNTSV